MSASPGFDSRPMHEHAISCKTNSFCLFGGSRYTRSFGGIDFGILSSEGAGVVN
jgi:hypothetical protein